MAVMKVETDIITNCSKSYRYVETLKIDVTVFINDLLIFSLIFTRDDNYYQATSVILTYR